MPRLTVAMAWAVLLLVAVAGGAQSSNSQRQRATQETAPTVVQDLDAVVEIITEDYVDADLGVDWQTLGREYRARVARATNPVEAYQLLNELVAQLGDPNTFVVPAALREAAVQAAQEEDQPEEEYAGIGVMIQPVQPSGILVVSVFEGSPAKEAGVLVGDLITGVADWQPTSGDPVEAYVERIRGPVGSSVILSLTSPYGQERQVAVHRGNIDLRPAVTHRTLSNRIAYLRLPALTSALVEQASRILPQLLRAPGLVLDLRTVQGGDPQGVVQLAQWFLGAANLGSLVHRDERQRLPARPDAIAAYRRPMVVLIDQRTFGLAEILATLMRAYSRAQLIGRTTQGGFALTTLSELPTGAMLRMSVARYVSPEDKLLPATGIEPDAVVEQPDLDAIRAGQDPDIDQALQILSGGGNRG